LLDCRFPADLTLNAIFSTTRFVGFMVSMSQWAIFHCWMFIFWSNQKLHVLKLKNLELFSMTSGSLQVNRKYRIAPSSPRLEGRSPKMLLLELKQKSVWSWDRCMSFKNSFFCGHWSKCMIYIFILLLKCTNMYSEQVNKAIYRYRLQFFLDSWKRWRSMHLISTLR